jgi:hypothetical protein
MWTVIFVSQDEDKINKLVSMLNNADIMTRLQYSREDDFSAGQSCKILVPHTELEAAQEIIFDNELIN